MNKVNTVENRDKQYSFIISSWGQGRKVDILKQRKGCLILFCHFKKIYRKN